MITTGKVLLVIATILNAAITGFAFSHMPIRMRLQNENNRKIAKHSTVVDEILKYYTPCTKKFISVDTIILNVYKIKNFYMNVNSPTITILLNNKMENIFYINEYGDPEKLLNTTSIVPNKLRNFFLYELDSNMDIDCILYKS